MFSYMYISVLHFKIHNIAKCFRACGIWAPDSTQRKCERSPTVNPLWVGRLVVTTLVALAAREREQANAMLGRRRLLNSWSAGASYDRSER